MSLPTDPRSNVPLDPQADPHADLLVASAVRAAADTPTAGCPDAELLALYAERALSTSELTLVEPHLDGCPRCQAVVAACVRALPHASEPSSAPAGAFDPGAHVRSWFAGWRWLVPITSVAAVALVAVWIGRGPSGQVARQASSEGLARDERASELPRPAAPATPAPTSGDTPAARDARAGAALEADARRPAAGGAGDAAAAPPATQQERRALRLEDAQAKAVAASPVPDARQRAEAPAAADVLPREQTATRERAEAAPPLAARAPAASALGARAPGAAAGRAGNEVGAARLASSILTGSVTYRARVALPAGAVIEVRLLDVSSADPSASLGAGAPADTLARAEVVTRGEQVPVAFSLSYDPNVIQARRRYVVQATIAVEGRIAWRTTTPHPVFVDGAAPTSPVTIVVDQMR